MHYGLEHFTAQEVILIPLEKEAEWALEEAWMLWGCSPAKNQVPSFYSSQWVYSYYKN
jgi:hypothetical protein